MGYKLTGAYIGQTKVRPSGGGGWQPGANTVGYRPLTTQTQGADQSGNGYDLTGSYRTFGTYGGVDCVYVDGGSSSDARLYNSSFPVGNNRTALVRFYCTGTGSGDQGIVCTGNGPNGTIGTLIKSGQPAITDWWTHNEYGTGNYNNAWHLATMTWDGSTASLYIDSQLNTSYSYSNKTSDTGIAFSHKTYHNSGSQYSERFTGYLSEAIYEDKVRTAQEVADYYNQTKGDYGIS